MKKFSPRRMQTLRKKLSLTEGLFPQICGYLTPVEIAHLLEMGMRQYEHAGWYGSREYVMRAIAMGDCRPGWVYFILGPHNPAFVAELTRKGS